MRKNFSPLPKIIQRLFKESDDYVAAGWYGFLYPETPFVMSHAKVEFLVSYDILKHLGNNLRIKVDEMEYEVKLYSVAQNILKAKNINRIKIPANPLKVWLLTRSLARGVPEELAELVMATYSPVAHNPIAQAIRAKLLGLMTKKEPETSIRLDYPVTLRYAEPEIDVDWLDDLWKRGIILYLDEWSARRAIKKLIATIGWKYITR